MLVRVPPNHHRLQRTTSQGSDGGSHVDHSMARVPIVRSTLRGLTKLYAICFLNLSYGA